MPLIYVGQYNNIKPGMAQFDMSNFQQIAGDTGSVSYFGDAFYGSAFTSGSTNSGKVYYSTNAALGFTKQNITTLPSYGYRAFTRNNTSGRLMQIPTNTVGATTGTFYYSDDNGYSWSYRTLPLGIVWKKIASNNNGTVIAVGTDTNTTAYYAAMSVDDGYTWTNISSKTTGDFVTYVARLNMWIMTAAGGTLKYSTDNGTTWKVGQSPNASVYTVSRIIDTGTMLVMGISKPTDYLKTSTDGINWSPASVPTAPYTSSQKFFQDFAYCNGLYVCVFDVSTIYTSTDLVTWSQGDLPFITGSTTVRQTAAYAAFGNNQLVLSSTLRSQYSFYQF